MRDSLEFDVSDALEVFAVSKSWANHIFINNSILGSVDSSEMISRAELKVIIQDACNLLSLIDSDTTEISGEKYVTCSKIIPIVNCLIVIIDRLIPKTKISTCLQQNILNQIKRRFYSEKSNIEKNKDYTCEER